MTYFYRFMCHWNLFLMCILHTSKFISTYAHAVLQLKFYLFTISNVLFISYSKSPLQDIMNTPKFQMRKMQRQMIKERDYRDGLERELASKLALIAQKGTTFYNLFVGNCIVRLGGKRNSQNNNIHLLYCFLFKSNVEQTVPCQLLVKVNPVGN